MKLLWNLVKPVLWLLGYIIPKQAGLVVFSQSRGRYSDNSRALFEWMAHHSPVTVVWLYSADEPQVPDALRQQCVICPRHSMMGLWYVLRARVAILSHGINDFDRLHYGLSRARIVMLWHAIMVKSAYLTDVTFSTHRKARYLRRESGRFAAVIASSEVDRYHTAAYMGVHADRVHVTGLPRQDALVRAMANRQPRQADTPTRVLYAPTYRDTQAASSQSLFFPFEDWDENRFADFCLEHRIQIFLRPHPNDRVSVRHGEALASSHPQVFIPATNQHYPDTVEILPQIDAVITDYSSIYLDLLPFDIPCVFIPFDIDEYTAHRGLAYPYDLITPGPKVFSTTDLEEALQATATGAPEWAEERLFVSRLFFAFQDDRSCQRVNDVVQYLSGH